MTCILGIDPGQKGGLAFYWTEAPDRVSVEDMPVVDKRVNGALFASRVKQMRPDFAIIELVGSMPTDGRASIFVFGKGCGKLEGVLDALEVPYRFVTPPVWKKHFRLSKDKEESRALALRFFPACASSFEMKKHEGRAEAALIARYGAETQHPSPPTEWNKMWTKPILDLSKKLESLCRQQPGEKPTANISETTCENGNAPSPKESGGPRS